MIRGTYVGPDKSLAGKPALLMYRDGGLLAQFDDRSTQGGLAYGWHKFAMVDFTVDSEDIRPAPAKG
jgi:hypothetical protein